MHITTQKIYKIITTVVIIAAVFIASYAFAILSNGPTQNPPAGNRSPFLNTGPIEQVKEGRLDIGTTNTNNVAFSVDGGVANLIGGINVLNNTSGATIAATVDAPMYIGYSMAGAEGTPSTLEINNKLHVAGTIRDTSLAHTGNTPAPVCVNASGILIPCAPPVPITIQVAPTCTLMSYSQGTTTGTHDSVRCTKIYDSNNDLVTSYEIRAYHPRWGVPFVSNGFNSYPSGFPQGNEVDDFEVVTPTWNSMGIFDLTTGGYHLNTSPLFYIKPSNIPGYSANNHSYPVFHYPMNDYLWNSVYMDQYRMSIRGISGSVVGPWGDFNTVVPGPGQVVNN